MKHAFIICTSMLGPATVMGDDGTDILIGIIGSSIGDCGDPSYYTLLTSVYANIDWIWKTMKNP